MQAALDESNVPHDDYKVKEVMESWIKQSGYPIMTVTRNYETGRTIISQKEYNFLEKEKEKKFDNVFNHTWSIPVTFTTQTNMDFFNTIPNYWLKQLNQNITLETDPDDWIIFNLQQTGE
jgi:aminopeptidase N